MKYIVTNQNQKYEVEVFEEGDSLKMTIGHGPMAEKFDVDFKPAGRGSLYSMLVNDKSYRVIIDRKGSRSAVFTRGYRFEFDVEDERTYLMKSHIGHTKVKSAGDVKAPIPGLVSKILLKEGSPVEQGQGVMILEAMKMENEIKSPVKGILKKLNISEGKNVEKGQSLFVVDEKSESQIA